MVQKCDNSLYVAGIKVRSGQVVATWTGKDGREYQARVFTGAKGAALHHERTGETVITIDELARLQGVAIRARIDGIDGELALRPGARGRAGRQQFDHRALRAQLGKEGYRQALDVATRNLPVAPGASVKYSRKVTDAWLRTQSPVGLARTMAERPGTLVASTDSLRKATFGNSGALAAVLCERIHATLRIPDVPLGPLVVELEHVLQSAPVLGDPLASSDALDPLVRAAMERLTTNPHEAIETLMNIGAKFGTGVAHGLVLPVLCAQALLERAMLTGDARLRHAAEAAVDAAVDSPFADPGPMRAAVIARAEQRVAAVAAVAAAAGGESASEEPGSTVVSWKDGRMQDAFAVLDSIPREVGALPSGALVAGTIRDGFEPTVAAAEARWGVEAAKLVARHATTVSTSEVSLGRRGWYGRADAAVTEPAMYDGVPAIARAFWIGIGPDGSVTTCTAGDRYLQHGGMVRQVDVDLERPVQYASVEDALSARPSDNQEDMFRRVWVGRLIASLEPPTPTLNPATSSP